MTNFHKVINGLITINYNATNLSFIHIWLRDEDALRTAKTLKEAIAHLDFYLKHARLTNEERFELGDVLDDAEEIYNNRYKWYDNYI